MYSCNLIQTLKRIVQKISTENQEQIEEKTKPVRLCDLIDQAPIMERIMKSLGQEDCDITEFSKSQGKPYQTVDNYIKNKRAIPWDLLFHATEKTGKSIDWFIYGEDRVVYCASGKSSVNDSSAQNQISIANMGPVGTVSSVASGNSIRPGLERLIAILDHYGSPALFKKIEKMVLDMYGDDYPENIPTNK